MLLQELGSGREIREKQEGNDTPGNTAGTEYQEDIHPAGQSRGDVSDSISNQSMSSISNRSRFRQEVLPSEHSCDTIGTIVQLESQGLLE